MEFLRNLWESIVALFNPKPDPTPPPVPPVSPPVSPPPVSPPPSPPVSPPPSPPSPPPPTPGPSKERTEYLACINAQIGKPYEWGTAGPNTFDCSGLVSYCFHQATGRELSRDSHGQYKTLASRTKGDLQPGDLAYYDTMGGLEVREGNKASHVNTVSMPGLMEVGAMNEDMDVKAVDPTSEYWTTRLLGYRTLPFQETPGGGRTITTSTPFRDSGTVTKDRLKTILASYPLGAESDAIHDAVRGQALPVAQSWMESRYGQDESARKTHNPLGLLWYPGMVPVMPTDSSNSHGVPLIVFATWADAFAEWNRRMTDVTYKGGVYAPQTMPLRDFFSTYVGGPECKTSNRATCANNETKATIDHYESETIARINRYLGSLPSPPPPSGGTSYAVAGLTVPIALSFPLKQMIVSSGMTNNRPGIRMTPDRWVQHETDNTNPGAGAHMHASYLANGAEGRQASWHFTVDDTECWQSIPVNEVSWQGGDGAGPCNMKGVSCELCVNMLGNPQRMDKARKNAEELCAQIMKAMHLSIIEGHTDCCARQGNPAGCHSACPKYMITQGYWPQKFKSGVASFRNS